MIGVILCGGQSSRMGSDKGMMATESKTWARSAFDKLSQLGIPVFVSVNTLQKKVYESLFSTQVLITDAGSLLLKGPLAAVLSVHLQYPSEDIFVLACDMPFMEPSVLNELYQLYQQNNLFDAFVFTTNGEPEPLCGIYTAKGLAVVLKMYYDNRLIKHSMKFMLEQVAVYKTAVPDNKKICFRNINTHADLNGL